MKLGLFSVMPCVVVTRKAEDYDSNGRKGVSYTIGVASEGQVADLPCTQAAYDDVGVLGQYSEVVLHGEFDTNYKKFKVVAVDSATKK